MSRASSPQDPPFSAARRSLVVYARLPEAGKVKTRLQPPLTPAQALALHEAMLADTLERMIGALQGEAWIMLAWDDPPTPSILRGDLAELASRIPQEVQSGASLGDRMAVTLALRASQGFDRVVFIGSDAPHLPAGRVREAFASLETADVVLGPADDGGYYLLGARRTHPALFTGIPWGTGEVLAVTRRRLREAGLAWSELAPDFDVDTAADATRLRDALRRAGAAGVHDLPQRTRRVLEEVLL